jgi:hypothetical protein
VFTELIFLCVCATELLTENIIRKIKKKKWKLINFIMTGSIIL